MGGCTSNAGCTFYTLFQERYLPKKVHSEKKDTVLKKDVVVLKRKENAAIRLNWKKLIRRMMLLVRITNFFTILTLKILTEEMSYVIVNTWQVM